MKEKYQEYQTAAYQVPCLTSRLSALAGVLVTRVLCTLVCTGKVWQNSWLSWDDNDLYVSGQMEGAAWVRNILLTCVVFCCPLFLMFCINNTIAITYRVSPVASLENL